MLRVGTEVLHLAAAPSPLSPSSAGVLFVHAKLRPSSARVRKLNGLNFGLGKVAHLYILLFIFIYDVFICLRCDVLFKVICEQDNIYSQLRAV
jgi:hypothetical protein